MLHGARVHVICLVNFFSIATIFFMENLDFQPNFFKCLVPEENVHSSFFDGNLEIVSARGNNPPASPTF